MKRVDPGAVYFVLDAVSATIAAYVAAFFLRARSLAPGRGLGLIATAFAALALGYLSVAADALVGALIVDALRAATGSAAALFLFVYYAARRGAWSLATTATILVAGCTLTAFYVLMYAIVPAGALSPPSETLPWLRLAGAVLLILAALLVTMEVRAKTFVDFRVPLALICLAFAQYTIALLSFHGRGLSDPLPYAWRLAGLALLASVVITSGGVRLREKA